MRMVSLFPRLLAACLCAFAAAVPAFAQQNTFIPFASRRDVAHDAQRDLLYIASGSTGTVARYDLAARQFLAPLNVGGQPVQLDIMPDSSRLAIADAAASTTQQGFSTSGPVVVDLATGTSSRVAYTDGGPSAQRGVESVAFASDGSLLFTTTSPFVSPSGTVRWQLPGNTFATVLRSDLGSVQLEPNLAHDAIGFVQVGESGGRFGVWRTADASFVRSQKDGSNLDNIALPGGGTDSGTRDFNNEVALAPDGAHLAVGANLRAYTFTLDRTQPQQFEWVDDLDLNPAATPLGVAYAPDGQTLYVAWRFYNTADAVYAYDTGSFAVTAAYPVGEFITDGIGGGDLQVSNNGSLLFATVDGGVRVISVPEPAGALAAAVALAATPLLSRRRERRWR